MLSGFLQRTWTRRIPAWFAALPLLFTGRAQAHVKWFGGFDFRDPPLELGQVLTPLFWTLAGVSAATILLFVWSEGWVSRRAWVRRFEHLFNQHEDVPLTVMRIGIGMTLLLCWQAGTLLAPDFASPSAAALWAQFALVILLCFRPAVAWAGAGLVALYAYAGATYGFFRVLDYLLFVGVGWYFIAQSIAGGRWKRTALPALYASTGFCLLWLGIEKLVYPSWSAVLLERHPVLALGLDHGFFVVAAGFIELSLGFMLLICLQERLLALTITLVFFLTSLVFGRAEVVGHTPIHATLIVFLIAGAGRNLRPLYWLPSLRLRVPVVVAGYFAVLFALLVPYTVGAHVQHARILATEGMGSHAAPVEAGDPPPSLSLAVQPDPHAGWNLRLRTENFRFVPAHADQPVRPGEGHAHLMIDGRKVARLYAPWHHIAPLPAGPHRIEVTLHATDHALLLTNGAPVRAETEVE